METFYAEGGNYRIEIAAGMARFRLWVTPNLDSSEGARLALEVVGHFRALATNSQVASLLMDIREGPIVCGPKTQAAIGEMLACFERVRRPIAVCVGNAPIQVLQYKRLVASHAPQMGRVFPQDQRGAESWLRNFDSRH